MVKRYKVDNVNMLIEVATKLILIALIISAGQACF